MKKYIIYSHDGSGNHGCEALVRTTIDLLGITPEQTVLVSTRPEEDIYYGINQICKVVKIHEKKAVSKKSMAFLKAYWDLKINHNYEPLEYIEELAAVQAKHGDVAISIGGDSYCYGFTKEMALRNRIWKYGGLKTVYWGCSIEPDLLKDREIATDISTFDLITARETISYEALKRINPNTVLVTDSAFFLKATDCQLSENFSHTDLVGINLSPLAEGLESSRGLTKQNYEELIEYILKNTTMNILLIPHVIWDFTDDRTTLKYFYEKYKHTDRILTIEDHNCMVLKGYISKCRFFVGARTHATIAAYSCCIPTLVLGYSIKARGIARDLFGDEEHYLVSVQDLLTKEDLKNAFIWIYEHEQEIKNHLKQVLPEYKGRIEKGIQLLKTL